MLIRALLILLLASCASIPIQPTEVVTAESGLTATSTTINFVVSSELFPNPERGFFVWTGFWPNGRPVGTNIPPANFNHVRNQGYSLTRPYIMLDPTRPISQAELDGIAAQFAKARAAGIKVVLRFSYNFPPNSTAGEPDAPVAMIQIHLAQLKPMLEANTDVIFGMEAGFVGAWGEWHHSTSGSDTIPAKGQVLQAIRQTLSSSRTPSLRYPGDMRALGNPIVGSHQDCFLASADDWGTWGLVYQASTQKWIPDGYTADQDKAYVVAQNRIVGGETCNYNPPRSDCTFAKSELLKGRWTYLNAGYEPKVLQSWKDQGCFNEVSRRLGYRIELISLTFKAPVTRGRAVTYALKLKNTGYSNPINRRVAWLVLVPPSGPVYKYQIGDVRKWIASTKTQSFSVAATLPMNALIGTYKLALWMPDLFPSLESDSRYAIRFANVGVWDAATGYNILGTTQVQ